MFVYYRADVLLCAEVLTSIILTHSHTTNFRPFQTKRICRRQFHIDENGRKFFKCLETNVGKGEIAHYEQFLLFPQCFQKACTAHI